MYRLMLVEDEEIIRRGIRNQIPWAELGMASSVTTLVVFLSFAGYLSYGETSGFIIRQMTGCNRMQYDVFF